MCAQLSSEKFKRTRKRGSKIEALNMAQKIAFAPFTFQATAAMLELGILKLLSLKKAGVNETAQKLNISKYAVQTLFDAALTIGLIEQTDDNNYIATELGEAFLYDEMTIVNFNFTKDVCYLGASALCESFLKSAPLGLQKFISNSPTIYPVLPDLDEKVKKSWWAFDHFYSNDCFLEVLKIIFKNNPKKVFDIGANTGNFACECLEFNKECSVVVFDLPLNIELAKKNIKSKRCSFAALDILEQNLPEISGAVLMSQFLDCFSKEQIIKILNKTADAIDSSSRVYILEPFIDNQQYEGAAFALTHISLYFTAIANGVSKMYSEREMLEIIEKSNLKVLKTYYNIGKYDYTLLECTRADNELV